MTILRYILQHFNEDCIKSEKNKQLHWQITQLQQQQQHLDFYSAEDMISVMSLKTETLDNQTQ